MKRVEDTEAVVQQEQEDMRKGENLGLMNMDPKKIYQEMMVAIRDSVSDLAGSDDGEDGDDMDDKEPELGWLSDNDEPGLMIHTIT
jgi:hypothetical protein